MARSLTSFELQALIRSKRPAPAGYAPTKVPRDQRVPVAQATIAATVDRSPQGEAEPPSGFGIGPNAGRVADDQPSGDPGETVLSRPDIIAEQHEEAVTEAVVELKTSDAPDILTPAKGETPNDGWTVPELKKYAKDNDIDLKGATTKAAILAVLTGE